jgi:hypothetical protein
VVHILRPLSYFIVHLCQWVEGISKRVAEHVCVTSLRESLLPKTTEDLKRMESHGW